MKLIVVVGMALVSCSAEIMKKEPEKTCRVGMRLAESIGELTNKSFQLMDMAMQTCMMCTLNCLCGDDVIWEDVKRCADADPTLHYKEYAHKHEHISLYIGADTPLARKKKLLNETPKTLANLDKDLLSDMRRYTDIEKWAKHLVTYAKNSTQVSGVLRYPLLGSDIAYFRIYQLRAHQQEKFAKQLGYVGLELSELSYYAYMENYDYLMTYIMQMNRDEMNMVSS